MSAKVLCLNIEKEVNQSPFSGVNYLDELTYEKLEKKLNFLFEISYDNYIKEYQNKTDYVMSKTDTIDYFLKFLEKKTTKI